MISFWEKRMRTRFRNFSDMRRGLIEIQVDLLRYGGARLADVDIGFGPVRSVVIPLGENPGLYVGEEGIWQHIAGIPVPPNEWRKTHLLKQMLPKEVYGHMSVEERMAQPVMGFVRYGPGYGARMEEKEDREARKAAEARQGQQTRKRGRKGSGKRDSGKDAADAAGMMYGGPLDDLPF